MKSWLLAWGLLGAGLPGWRWLTQVSEHNAAQARGQAAATWGRAPEAVYYYQQAVALAGRGGPSSALLLNLAQAQAQAGQAAAARATYGQLLAPAVPAAIGSTARQQLAVLLAPQQPAQAMGLLRQALKLDPANATARYNYELLSQYLAGQRPDNLPRPPASPPPAPAPKAHPPRDSAQQGNDGQAPKPAAKSGTDRPGEAPDPSQPPAGPPTGPGANGASPPLPQPAAPSTDAGGTNGAGRRPGAGSNQPLPSGTAPGSQRGLDGRAGAAASPPTPPSAEPALGRRARPGTDPATDADRQLQTQRERLKAMNLTPAQAQQLLNALRESEQQYLQQRPRTRQGAAPAPDQPTW